MDLRDQPCPYSLHLLQAVETPSLKAPSKKNNTALQPKATVNTKPSSFLFGSDVMQASSAKLHFWTASLVVYSLLHLLWMPLLASTRHVCVQQLPSPAPGSLPCQENMRLFESTLSWRRNKKTTMLVKNQEWHLWCAPLKLRKLLAIPPQVRSTLVPSAVHLTVVAQPFQLQYHRLLAIAFLCHHLDLPEDIPWIGKGTLFACGPRENNRLQPPAVWTMSTFHGFGSRQHPRTAATKPCVGWAPVAMTKMA